MGRGVTCVGIALIAGCGVFGYRSAPHDVRDSVDGPSAPLVMRPEAVPQRPQTPTKGDHKHGAVSEDGRVAVTAVGHAVYIWDVERHRQVRSEQLEEAPTDSTLALYPDGETLAIFENDVRLCRLRELTCARQHVSISGFDRLETTRAGFTQPGRQLWACFSYHETIVFDLANPARNRHFRGCAIAIFDDARDGFTVYTQQVRAMHRRPDGVETDESIAETMDVAVDRGALSADGTLLAVGGLVGGAVIDLAHQNAVRVLTSDAVDGISFDGHTPVLLQRKLPDMVRPGDSLAPVGPVHTVLVAYEEHGERKLGEQDDVLAIAGTTRLTDDLHVIAAKRTTALEAPALAPAVSAASSPSGNMLAIAVGARAWRWSLFDARGATEVDLGRTPAAVPASVRFVGEDELVITREDVRTVSLADDSVRVLPDSAVIGAPSVVTVSPDRTRVFHATGAGGEIGTVWRRPFATAVHLVIPHYPVNAAPEKVVSAAFSQSGDLLITGSSSGAARLWDASSGAALARLELTFEPRPVAVSDRSIAVTGDAGDDVGNDWDHSRWVRRWSFARGLDPRVDAVIATRLHAVSPTGSLLADHDVVDMTGAKKWGIPTLDITAASFSEDGSRLVVTDEGKDELHVFEAGHELDVVRLGGAHPRELAFQRADLVRGLSADGVVRFWRVCATPTRCDRAASGEILQVIGTGTDWIAVDRSGRYDTSSFDALNDLAWVLPDRRLEAVPADLFIRDYYVPGLVSKVLTGDSLPPAADLAAIDRRVPRVSISKVEPVPGQPARAKVTLDVDAGGGEAFDLRLFRDGSLAAEHREPVRGGPNALAFEIELSRKAPHVELTAYAFNQQRLKGPTAHTTYNYEPAKAGRPRAVIVGVGVGPSGDKLSTLDYAPLDAIAMSRALATQLSARYNVVQVALASASPRWATVGEPCMAQHRTVAPTTDAIAAVLARLAGRLHEASAAVDIPLPCDVPSLDLAHLEPLGPDDVLILYVSAHGVAVGGEFALVAEGGRKFLASELAAALSSIASDHIVVILDTCASGAAVEAGAFRPAPLADVTFGQLAYDKSMQILSASGANEEAIDSPDVGGSLLVHALRERLANGPVPMGALLRGARHDVPELFRQLHLAGQVQKPVVFDYRRGRDEVVLGAP